MKIATIFLYEWKHFVRSPFKIIAVILFLVAGIYGLHNGYNLYNKQANEIEKVTEKIDLEKHQYLVHFENNEKGPKEKPWIDVTDPFWAIYLTDTYHFKKPQPTMIYAVGQTEQYGFFKNINAWSTVYDADMAEEIANPERLQIGTLDFSFVILFLLPLLLLILLYNVKGLENEQGFLPLIYVQTGSKNWWLLTRVCFYTLLSIILILGLMFYGVILNNIFEASTSVFWTIFTWFLAYLFIWIFIYFIILKFSKSTIVTTLQMIGFWVLFAFIIPATVHQYIAIKKPNNLMVDFIDLKRDGSSEIQKQGDSIIKLKVFKMYPELNSLDDSLKTSMNFNKKRFLGMGLLNNLLKKNSNAIERENCAKNELVQQTYWFNPITYFQNELNLATRTHYIDYQDFRNEIQVKIDEKFELMLMEIWKEVKVDKEIYLNYATQLNK